jgi:hypothetical protein
VVIEIIVIHHRYFAKMGGNARMAMLTHEERSALDRKPLRAKKSTFLSCDTNPSTGNLTLTTPRARATRSASTIPENLLTRAEVIHGRSR